MWCHVVSCGVSRRAMWCGVVCRACERRASFALNGGLQHGIDQRRDQVDNLADDTPSERELNRGQDLQQATQSHARQKSAIVPRARVWCTRCRLTTVTARVDTSLSLSFYFSPNVQYTKWTRRFYAYAVRVLQCAVVMVVVQVVETEMQVGRFF